MAISVTAFGMRHEALGTAILDEGRLRLEGSLDVEGLGPAGGVGGVRQVQPRGSAGGGITTWFEMGDLVADGALRIDSDPEAAGGLAISPDRIEFLGAITGGGAGTPPSPETLVGVEFPDATGVVAELRLGGVLVAEQAFPAPWPAALARVAGGTGQGIFAIAYRNATVREIDKASPKLAGGLTGSEFSVDSFFDITYSSSIDIDIGAGAVVADGLRLVVSGVRSRGEVRMSGYRITASGVSGNSFTLLSSSLMSGSGSLFPADSNGDRRLSAGETLRLAARSLASGASDPFSPDFVAKATELWQSTYRGGYSSSSDAIAPNNYNSSR